MKKLLVVAALAFALTGCCNQKSKCDNNAQECTECTKAEGECAHHAEGECAHECDSCKAAAADSTAVTEAAEAVQE